MAQKFDEGDAIEIAAHLMGQDTFADDFNESALAHAFEERFHITIPAFAYLATELAKRTFPTESQMQVGKKYQGFVDLKEGAYIAKIQMVP